jgi:hypothetical protein
MPHERSSTPVPPSDFSTITLADRKIRFRRELPATRLTSTVLCLISEEAADQKELGEAKSQRPEALKGPPG